MSQPEWKIAKIKRAFLGYEDHGILTCMLDLDYGGSGQGAGGYGLDEPIKDEDGKFLRRRGSAYGMEYVARLMKACGVRSWDKMVGRTVYALSDWGKVYAIKPLPTEKGEEFVFDSLREEFFEKEMV